MPRRNWQTSRDRGLSRTHGRSAAPAGEPNAKASDPTRRTHGTIASNVRAGVSNSNSAPARPPARLTSIRIRTGRPPIGRKTSRYARALARLPGNRATVLEALAWTDGTPTATKAGSVTNDPPPPAAFIAPASSPPPSNSAV
jgi:hypothetical protein